MSDLSLLPEGWAIETIGNLILSSNTGLVRGVNDQSSDKEFSYFKMNNLSTKGKFELTNLVKVDATNEELLKYSLQAGDFIFNTRNSVELVGKCGVLEHEPSEPVIFNNNLLRITFRHINPRIISFWFNSADGKSQLRSVTSATTSVAAIYQKALIALEVPIPPLAEQKVITDKLDELLTQVESTKARLDAIPAILKSFRQSVLAAAVSGELTEEWRGENSKLNVWKSNFNPLKIEQQSEPFDLPSLWSWEHLGHTVTIHNNLRKPIKQSDRDKRPGQYPYYGAFGVIDDFDDFVFDGIYILLAEDGKNLEVRSRPISLIAKGKFWVNNHAHVLKPREGILFSYINYFLNSPVALIDQFLTGQDQVKLNRKAMELIPISVPPIEEQAEIVRRIEELFAFADKVEAQVNAAQLRVNNLTQSILAKAFRGELTAEWRTANPELISGDNSASALLKCIKSERTKLKPTKKTKA
ncbi:restriction endonuclease subunit S [Shewanella baltica]|uniref:restriction endonuclease subunit S n=1 Tax=Shewanella baltica TaxID=62322 RepID=UPI00325EBD00